MYFFFSYTKKLSACFSQLYCDYIEVIKKGWIIDFEIIDAFFEIKIISNFFDIDPYKECNISNELFEQHNRSCYGFDPFF